jgi:hypothetical protein
MPGVKKAKRMCGLRKEIPTRCNNVPKLVIPYLHEAQHVSGNTTHQQEPKTALAASGFSYVEGCLTCSWWTLSGTVSTSHTSNNHPHIKNQKLQVQF